MKPLTAYAIVKKKNPKLSVYEIYEDDDVKIDKKTEMIIKVKITEIK